MTRAVRNVNEKLSEALIGLDPTFQSQIDQAMIDLDKTEKKVIYVLYELGSTIKQPFKMGALYSYSFKSLYCFKTL